MIHFLSKTNPKKLRGIALLRLDFNTKDDWRLEASLPTVRLLARHAKSVVIVSHRGRPGVSVKDGVPESGGARQYSLRKDAKTLSRLLRKPVRFIPHFRFEEIERIVREAPRGSIFLLENIRFFPGEAANEARLGRMLARLADYYVNDAFAVSHRKAASLVAVTRYLPSYAGLGLEREITALRSVMKKPDHPFVVLIGGAKASDKLGVVQNLRRKADWFLIGGASANTLLKMKGVDIGASLHESDPKVLAAFQPTLSSRKLVLPEDWITKDGKIVDIGPRAAKQFSEKLRTARMLFWSGPMGKGLEEGSLAVARAIVQNRIVFSVVGGGETVAFLKKHRIDNKFSFISTGGGAMLEFLAGKKLPGIEALK